MLLRKAEIRDLEHTSGRFTVPEAEDVFRLHITMAIYLFHVQLHKGISKPSKLVQCLQNQASHALEVHCEWILLFPKVSKASPVGPWEHQIETRAPSKCGKPLDDVRVFKITDVYQRLGLGVELTLELSGDVNLFDRD